ncbi:MAG: hypothetical protein II964_00810 [Synergistaceae bacterium]|nr:hypothetical protein [Synergistaceae bacterium]
MSMSTTHSNTVTFSNVSVSGSSGTLTPSSQIYWNVYENGALFISDVHDDFGGDHTIAFENISGNTWQMSRTRSSGNPEITTVTFTSSTTASVTRDGYYDEYQNAHYQMRYTITKQ